MCPCVVTVGHGEEESLEEGGALYEHRQEPGAPGAPPLTPSLLSTALVQLHRHSRGQQQGLEC